MIIERDSKHNHLDGWVCAGFLDRRAISHWQKPVMASSLFSNVNKTLLMYQPSNARPHPRPRLRVSPLPAPPPSPYIRQRRQKNGESTWERRYFQPTDNLISCDRFVKILNCLTRIDLSDKSSTLTSIRSIAP